MNSLRERVSRKGAEQGANSGFGRSAQTEGVLEYGAIWHAIVIDCQIQDKALDISLLYYLPCFVVKWREF